MFPFRFFAFVATVVCFVEDRREGFGEAWAELFITEVRERCVKPPHPTSECINTVLADDDLMVSVIWTFAALVRESTRKEFSSDRPRFETPHRHVEALREALTERACDPARRPNDLYSLWDDLRDANHRRLGVVLHLLGYPQCLLCEFVAVPDEAEFVVQYFFRQCREVV